MKVFTYNGDARILAAKERLEAAAPPAARVHLLPIPLREQALLTPEALAEIRAGDLVCGYGITAPLLEAIKARGGRIFDAEGDEIFVKENAILTAEATMGYLLSEPRAPRDREIGIIGYGRIGAALCRILLFFGARVRVFTARPALRASLGASGIESRPISYEAGEALDLSGLDLIIQTAPACIFTAENAPACPLWNLAAAQYIGKGVEAKTLSALPAKIFYESGGAALARAVLRFTENEIKERSTL